MRVVHLLLIGILGIVLAGCIQNFKDNEVFVKNSSDGKMTIHINGTSYPLDPSKSVTIKLPPAKYGYGTVWSSPSTFPANVNALIASAGNGANVNLTSSASELSGEFDLTSQGTRYMLEYIASWETKVTPGKAATANEPAEPATVDLTYKVSGIATQGWTE